MKTIYFCGLREIHRKQAIEARGWWVAGGGREWTEAEGRQNIITNNIDFPGAGRRGARRRESEIGLIKYRSEMVSPLHQEVYRLELGTCVWSLLLSGSGCKGEQDERTNEKVNGRRAGEELFSLLWSTEKTRDWADKAGEWEGRRRKRALCRVL